MCSWELKLDLHACSVRSLPPELHAYALDKTSLFLFTEASVWSILLCFPTSSSSSHDITTFLVWLSKPICQDCCSCQLKMLKEAQLDSSNLFWEKSHASSTGSLNNMSIGRWCSKYLTLINLYWQKTDVRDLHGLNNTHLCNLENKHWMHNIFQSYSYYSCQKKSLQLMNLIWETISKACT